MEYKIGNSKKIAQIAVCPALNCPKCKQETDFTVFENLNFDVVPHPPLVDFTPVYFCVCANCAGIFGVPRTAAKYLKSGDFDALRGEDLKELSEFTL